MFLFLVVSVFILSAHLIMLSMLPTHIRVEHESQSADSNEQANAIHPVSGTKMSWTYLVFKVLNNIFV